MQMFVFWFGIGEILTTQALKPYVIGETNQTTGAQQSKHIMFNSDNYSNDMSVDRRSRIMIPTLIIGASIILSKCIFIRILN